MAVTLKLSDDLVELAKLHAAVEDNPELPLQFIKETLLAAQEAKAGMLTPYQFGS